MPAKTIAKAISLIAIIVAIYTQIIWFMVTTKADSDSKRDLIDSFLGYLPSFMRGIGVILYLTIICSILGIIFSIRWQSREAGSKKIIPIIILTLSCLIPLLTFYLM